MNPTLRSLLLRCIDYSGGFHLLHLLKRNYLPILMYHRFADDNASTYVIKQSTFKKQIDRLRKAFRIVSLSDVLKHSEKYGIFPDNALVITIDDGYEDFYRYAFPVLKKYNLSATVFLPTDFIDKKKWMWQDKIKYAVRNTKLKSLELLVDGKLELLSFLNRDNSFNEPMIQSQVKIYNECVRYAGTEQILFLVNFLKSMGVTLPNEPTQDYLPLTWGQIKEMGQYGIDYGAHTCSHRLLTTLTEQEIQYELIDSKKIIENRLQKEIVSFCYPNNSYNEKIVAAVKECGYKGAAAGYSSDRNNVDMCYSLSRKGAGEMAMLDFLKILYIGV